VIDRNWKFAETEMNLNFGSKISMPKPKSKFRQKMGQNRNLTQPILTSSPTLALAGELIPYPSPAGRTHPLFWHYPNPILLGTGKVTINWIKSGL